MADLNIGKTDSKKKLLELDEQTVVGIYGDMGLAPPTETVSKEELVEGLIQKLDAKGKNQEIDRIVKYFDYYPIINSFSKKDIITFIPKGMQNNIKSKNKGYVLDYLKKFVFNGTINLEILGRKTKNYEIVSKVKKIINEEELAYLANCLWGDVEKNIGREEIVKRINTGLEHGELLPEKIEELLRQTKNRSIKARSQRAGLQKVGGGKIEPFEQRLSSIEGILKKQERQISELDRSLKKIIDLFDSNLKQIKSCPEYFENKFVVQNSDNLLWALRKESLDLTVLKEGSFDSIKEKLKRENISDIDLLRDGLAVVVMDYLMKLTKEIDWDVSLDQFYRILSEEIFELKGTVNTIAEIPPVRDRVCRRMGISAGKFDSFLLDCFENNWVRLEVGTPIGKTDVEWLDTGKNRFYYVKLIRK